MNTKFDTIKFIDPTKERIQRLAFGDWEAMGHKGTLEIATGVGKTMIGLMAIQQEVPCKSIIIAVPTVTLQDQWVEAINKHLGNYKNISNKIGCIGGGLSEWNKPIKVCIINSIRDKILEADLLILDEFHRYGSAENFKFIQRGKFKKILGLTATTSRQDGAHLELFKYAPLVFSYTQKQAIDDNVLCKFSLVNIAIKLTQEEQFRLSKITYHIQNNFHLFNNNFLQVQRAVKFSGPSGWDAKVLMGMFTGRKSLLLNCDNKIIKTIELICQEIDNNSKVLVFCEYIKTAKEIFSLLGVRKSKARLFYSSMKGDKKGKSLEDFKYGTTQVLISVKALDEGLNVPSADTAIIVGGTSVKRQMVQRLGRVLRKSEGKESCKVYQLYVKGTQDEVWMKNRSSELFKNAKEVEWR